MSDTLLVAQSHVVTQEKFISGRSLPVHWVAIEIYLRIDIQLYYFYSYILCFIKNTINNRRDTVMELIMDMLS